MLDSPTACGGGGEALAGSFPLREGKSGRDEFRDGEG